MQIAQLNRMGRIRLFPSSFQNGCYKSSDRRSRGTKTLGTKLEKRQLVFESHLVIDLTLQISSYVGCVFLWGDLDEDPSKEPMYPWPEWIHWFLWWWTMIRTDLGSLIQIRITPKERTHSVLFHMFKPKSRRKCKEFRQYLSERTNRVNFLLICFYQLGW